MTTSDGWNVPESERAHGLEFCLFWVVVTISSVTTWALAAWGTIEIARLIAHR